MITDLLIRCPPRSKYVGHTWAQGAERLLCRGVQRFQRRVNIVRSNQPGLYEKPKVSETDSQWLRLDTPATCRRMLRKAVIQTPSSLPQPALASTSSPSRGTSPSRL